VSIPSATPEHAVCTRTATSAADPADSIRIGRRLLTSRYFLAPLAGYTHLAFRQVIRELGGCGLATTDLVQASHLVSGTKWARELVRTNPFDRPLTVQIYGGVTSHLVAAARWLQDNGYEAIDINMGCPMAKVNGQGGGARLMCAPDSAVRLVEAVVSAVRLPVSVKMRLGWDRDSITAPILARAFQDVGVRAITIHGRTRQQGFHGSVHLDGIAAVVQACQHIPVVGNGDIRTPDDALRMRAITGCAAVAIGRGALLDPWIFRRIEHRLRGSTDELEVSRDEQVSFLRRHYRLMVEQHGEFASTQQFRKFAAWYGARLGVPEDLEDRLRRFESSSEFETIVDQIAARHGDRCNPRPTIELKTPNGPIEHW
jgi:nifR3 family TIM-barrel protein